MSSRCLLASFLALTLGLAPTVPAQAQESRDLVEVAVEAGTFKTLATAVQAAGLVDTLRGEGPFTVFAPTDEAFAKLPEATLRDLLRPENRDQLTRILTYHVVAGRVDSTTALRVGEAETVAGDSIRIRLEGGRLRVNDASVVANDVIASNGVIHVIDSVLLPPADERPEPNLAAAKLLESAINRGAPLYNAGQEKACAAIYETAIQAVLDFPNDLSKEGRRVLRRSLAQIEDEADGAQQAWILRRAMDTVVTEFVGRLRDHASAEVTPSTEERGIYSFDKPTPRWKSVNDDVMGGISEGGYTWHDSGVAVFSGSLSLENNGGFSTMRSPAADMDLDGYDGLVMRVKGDGRSYNFSVMRSDRRWEINNWRYPFETTDGEWTELRIPFRELVHTVMGRRVPGSGPLPADQIRSFSFMIADKNTDPFRLEVDWIKAYRDSVSF